MGEIFKGRSVHLGETHIESSKLRISGQFLEDRSKLFAVVAGGGVEVDQEDRGIVDFLVVISGVDLHDCSRCEGDSHQHYEAAGE